MKMESKNKLNEIDIKNHTCYYFDDINKIKEFDHDAFKVKESQLIRQIHVIF